MDIDTVITQLQATPIGSRKLDANIAQVLGWRLQSDIVVNPTTGEHTRRNMWFKPKSNEVAPVPFYTTNLSVAQNLAIQIAPGQKSGCAWEPGKASARIGNGPYIEASKPAIALCIAALTALKGKQAS